MIYIGPLTIRFSELNPWRVPHPAFHILLIGWWMVSACLDIQRPCQPTNLGSNSAGRTTCKWMTNNGASCQNQFLLSRPLSLPPSDLTASDRIERIALSNNWPLLSFGPKLLVEQIAMHSNPLNSMRLIIELSRTSFVWPRCGECWLVRHRVQMESVDLCSEWCGPSHQTERWKEPYELYEDGQERPAQRHCSHQVDCSQGATRGSIVVNKSNMSERKNWWGYFLITNFFDQASMMSL